MTGSYMVHIARAGGGFRPRPVPLVDFRDVEDADGALISQAVVPDPVNSERLMLLGLDQVALCYGTCQLCKGSPRPGRERPERGHDGNQGGGQRGKRVGHISDHFTQRERDALTR